MGSGGGKKKKGARDKDSNLAAVVIPENSRDVVRTLQEIVDCSEQEIYKMLVSCRMDPNEAITRLLSQDTFQEVKNKGDKKKEVSETKETSDSCSQEVDSSIQNGEFSNGDECDESKSNSDETSNVQGTCNRLAGSETSNVQGACNHLAGSSTTAGILGPYKSDLTNGETKIVPVSSAEAVPSICVPSSSDLTDGETKIVPISAAEAVPSISVPSSSDLANGETKIVPTSSAEAVPLISVPSSRDLTNVETKRVPKSSRKSVRPLPRAPSRLISATPAQKTMADVVKMSLGLSKESVTKAPLKDDCPLHEKSDVLCPFSLNESAATRDQLQEADSVTNQDLRDGDVTNPFSNSIIDSAGKSDQFRESAAISNQNLRDQIEESASVFNHNLQDNNLSYFSKSFVEYAARRDQLPESASVSNQKLCDDDVTNPFSNSFVESPAGRYHLWESASVSNQNLNNDYGGSRLLCDEDNNKNDEIYQVERHSFELNRTKDLLASVATCLHQLSLKTDEPKVSVNDDEPNHQQVKTSEHLIFGRYGSGQASSFPSQSLNDDSEEIYEQKASVKDDEPNHPQVKASELPHLTFGRFGSGLPSSFPAHSLNDDSEDTPDLADDLSFEYLLTRDDKPYEEEQQRQRRNVGNERMTKQVQYETHESAQENQSSATDFSVNSNQRLNPALAPSEPSLQMQNLNAFTDVKHQQADIREPDSLFPSFPFNQSMPTKHSITTASSLGRRPSVSMTEAIKPATIFVPHNHHYSQPEVPSGHHGHMMNPPYSPLRQNNSYNFSPSAFQQHGGRNNSTYHHQSLASMLPQHRNSNLPQSVVPTVPSAYSFDSNNNTNHHQFLASMLSQDRNSNLPQSVVPIVPSAYSFGSNNNTNHHQSLASMLPQHRNSNSNLPQSAVPIVSSANDPAYEYRNSNLPHSAVPIVPSANDPAYEYRNSNLPRSAVPMIPSANDPAYGSAYGFGTLSDNAANSEFEYGNVLRSLVSGNNHVPRIQHQSANSDMWIPQRLTDPGLLSEREYQSLISGHQNQQSPSFRHSQPQQQQQLYRRLDGRSNPYFLPPNLYDPRSDSSKPSQPMFWPKDKY